MTAPSSISCARRWAVAPLGAGRGPERTLHGPNEVRFTKRLPHHHCVGLERPNRRSITADKHVRNGPGAEDLLDGSDATYITQAHVDDHQVRSASTGGGHSIGLSGLDCTNMAHPCEHFGEQAADHGVVFHHEDAERPHRAAPPSAPPSFIQISIRSSGSDAVI